MARKRHDLVARVDDATHPAAETAPKGSYVALVGSPADGDTAVYDSALGYFVPVASGGGATTLDGLTDVDTTGVSDGDVLTYDAGTSSWAPLAPTGGGGGGVITAIAGATVATDQSTSSTSYTDLATVGPSVTLTTGTEVYITISATIYKAGSVDFSGMVSVAVSGATTLAASDANATKVSSSRAGNDVSTSRRFKLTGLTAGSNTFTLKYKINGGGSAFNFYNRDIVVEAV